MATPIVSPAAPPEEEPGTPLRIQAKPVSSSAGRSPTKAEQLAHAIVLTTLFAAPALMCVHVACANDLDIWWHMRAGEWMLQHHAIPHVDSFSSALAGKPWLDYSWLFELTVVKLFQRLGLVGIVAYSSAMILAITVALYHLVHRLQEDFTLAVLITIGAGCGMVDLYTPRPWLLTILFFVLELDILMHARRTGRTRELLWLPVIFALWANVHIQFVDGLFVLGIALAESVAARWLTSQRTVIRPFWIAGALLGSVLATLLNPFGWRIYSVAYDLATQAGALNKVSELHAMPFRDMANFTILVLAIWSTAVLAWQRRLQLFEWVLLAFAVVLSFRSQRDVWVVATVAAAILASAIVGRRTTAIRMPKFATALAAIAAALAVWAGFGLMHVNQSVLEAQVAKTLPLRAVQSIEAHGYTGPLYNDFNWGGYLIESLRMPVAIDGRQNLYGDKRIDRSVDTWGGQPDWASDPALTSAGLVVGPVKSPLIQLLRMDARFRLVFEDDVAAVFIARK